MTDESILTRLDLLDQYVPDLRETQPRSLQAYQDNKMLRRYIERTPHMAVDTRIQIGIGVLTQEGYRPRKRRGVFDSPENYHDIFIVLGEHAILPRDMVDGMTALVEFRNLQVYE